MREVFHCKTGARTANPDQQNDSAWSGHRKLFFSLLLAVLGIRDILVRIRICDPYLWLMDPTSFFSDFKDANNFSFFIFFYTLPAGTLSSVFKIKFLLNFCVKFYFTRIISVRSTPLRKRKSTYPLTNRRPKNIRILIRIPNNGCWSL